MSAYWPRLEAALSLIWRWRGMLEGEIGRGLRAAVCHMEQHVQQDDGEEHDHGRVQRARLDGPVEQRLDLLPPLPRQSSVAPLRRARHRLDGLDERRVHEGRDAVGERHREADLVRVRVKVEVGVGVGVGVEVGVGVQVRVRVRVKVRVSGIEKRTEPFSRKSTWPSRSCSWKACHVEQHSV
eukprot:scaffold51579_cov64-Phaeocystis_antarctica.AAC.1